MGIRCGVPSKWSWRSTEMCQFQKFCSLGVLSWMQDKRSSSCLAWTMNKVTTTSLALFLPGLYHYPAQHAFHFRNKQPLKFSVTAKQPAITNGILKNSKIIADNCCLEWKKCIWMFKREEENHIMSRIPCRVCRSASLSFNFNQLSTPHIILFPQIVKP